MGGSSCPSPPSTSRPGRPTISLWSSSVRSRAEGPRGDGARPREGPPSQSTSSAASSYGGPARAPQRSPARPRRGPSAGTSSSAALPPRSSPRCAPRRGAARPRGGSPPGGAGPPAAPPPDGRSWQIPPQRLLVVEGGRLDVQRLRAGEEAVLPPVEVAVHPAAHGLDGVLDLAELLAAEQRQHRHGDREQRQHDQRRPPPGQPAVEQRDQHEEPQAEGPEQHQDGGAEQPEGHPAVPARPRKVLLQ